MTAIDNKIAQTKKELHAKMNTLSLNELKIKFEIAVHSMDVVMIALTASYLKKWMGDKGFDIYTENVKATI